MMSTGKTNTALSSFLYIADSAKKKMTNSVPATINIAESN